jgi:hypothetical protein
MDQVERDVDAVQRTPKGIRVKSITLDHVADRSKSQVLGRRAIRRTRRPGSTSGRISLPPT